MKEWILERVREPSTYAAIGIGVMGVAVIADNFWIAIVGMAVSVAAFVLKENCPHR